MYDTLTHIGEHSEVSPITLLADIDAFYADDTPSAKYDAPASYYNCKGSVQCN